ncbi:unnamed protein product [Moneuplotes crassus]|uniref:Uncharacterized protein n=1 Tax=Euplotes crassus TaxID=5936 RepID=A0AAD1U8X8_EUPCR|nr:unnamed protein product [Moneuplotes crassus]
MRRGKPYLNFYNSHSIHLSDHVGSFYSKPPIFGYPVLNFSDINSDHYLAEESDTELFFQSSNSRNMINPTRRSFCHESKRMRSKQTQMMDRVLTCFTYGKPLLRNSRSQVKQFIKRSYNNGRDLITRKDQSRRNKVIFHKQKSLTELELYRSWVLHKGNGLDWKVPKKRQRRKYGKFYNFDFSSTIFDNKKEFTLEIKSECSSICDEIDKISFCSDRVQKRFRTYESDEEQSSDDTSVERRRKEKYLSKQKHKLKLSKTIKVKLKAYFTKKNKKKKQKEALKSPKDNINYSINLKEMSSQFNRNYIIREKSEMIENLIPEMGVCNLSLSTLEKTPLMNKLFVIKKKKMLEKSHNDRQIMRKTFVDPEAFRNSKAVRNIMKLKRNRSTGHYFTPQIQSRPSQRPRSKESPQLPLKSRKNIFLKKLRNQKTLCLKKVRVLTGSETRNTLSRHSNVLNQTYWY